MSSAEPDVSEQPVTTDRSPRVGPQDATSIRLGEVRGWPMVTLSNAALTVDVVPGLGGTITSIRRTRDDLEILWRSPWGVRARGTQSAFGTPESAYWESNPGGWQSIFPSGSESSTMQGTEWPMFGEARVAAFDHEIGDDQSLTMTARLVRSPFELTRTVTLHDDTVSLHVSIVNRGGNSVETIWSEQLALGAPLLGPEATVETSASIVHPDPSVVYDAAYNDIMPWPRTQSRTSTINLRNLPAADADERRLVYLDELMDAGVVVENPAVGLRVELDWDLESWPYVGYDLEAGHSSGFPHYDAAYYLLLQPSSSWPIKSVYDARRISSSTVWFEPGEPRTSHLDLRVTDLG